MDADPSLNRQDAKGAKKTFLNRQGAKNAKDDQSKTINNDTWSFTA